MGVLILFYNTGIDKNKIGAVFLRRISYNYGRCCTKGNRDLSYTREDEKSSFLWMVVQQKYKDYFTLLEKLENRNSFYN